LLTESIPQKLTYSQLPESNPSTVQKLPSAGSIQEAWAEFVKRFEPYDWYVTLTFKEPKHPVASVGTGIALFIENLIYSNKEEGL